jgi:cell division protein FtsQ
MSPTYQRILRDKNRKREVLFITIVGLIALLGILYCLYLLRGAFKIRDIYIYGNQKLRVDEIRSLINIRQGDELFGIPLREVYERLRSNPWIKEARLKKDLTGIVHISIREATPAALLQFRGRIYLVDTDGVLLEDIGETKTFFLPIIKGIDPIKNRPAYQEALSIVRFLDQKRPFPNPSGLEISGSRPEDIYVVVDGVRIIIGTGDYDLKMDRLDLVRKEVIKRNLSVDTIDLRFANKIIVRPEGDNAQKKASR